MTVEASLAGRTFPPTDPYVVTRLLTETVCGGKASANGVRRSAAKPAARKAAAKK